MRGRRSFRVLERPAPSPTSSKRPFDLQRAFDLIQGRRVGLRLTIGFRDVFFEWTTLLCTEGATVLLEP